MKALLAELSGTFALVFCGTASIAWDEVSGALGTAGIAAVFGGIVFLTVMAFRSVSGAHLNPAVTLALATAGLTKWNKVGPYITVQLAGALLASLLVYRLFPSSAHLGATIPNGPAWISFALEIALTSLLLAVILASSHTSTGTVAAVVGATVGVEALFAGPISGASMNPARTIAPALVSGGVKFIPLYSIATIGGAVAAAMLWRYRRNSQR